MFFFQFKLDIQIINYICTFWLFILAAQTQGRLLAALITQSSGSLSDRRLGVYLDYPFALKRNEFPSTSFIIHCLIFTDCVQGLSSSLNLIVNKLNFISTHEKTLI